MVQLVNNNFTPEKHKAVNEAIEKPQVVAQDYQSVIVTQKPNACNSTDSLLQYVDGSRANVIYFRQLLGENDSVTHHSQATHAVVQQYERIDNLEIIVDGGVNSSQSDDIRTTEINVSVVIRPPIIPNVGDVVLMDIGRGTLGWFNVFNVKRASHRANTVYQVEMELSYEVRDQINDQRLIDLNRKVISKYIYSADHAKNGQNPLLSDNLAEQYMTLRRAVWQLGKFWWETYYSRDYETCLVPNQHMKIYDPYFMKNIYKWFDSTYVKQMIYFRLFTHDEHPILSTQSVWDVIHNRGVVGINSVFNQAYALPTDVFAVQTKLNHIRHSMLDAIMAPIHFTYTNDIWLGQEVHGTLLPTVPDVSVNTYHAYKGIQLVNQIQPNKSYVFSMDFYHGNIEGQSWLELSLSNYLEDKPLQVDVLVKLVEDSKHWGVLERYYYIPTLIILIRYFLNQQ